MPRRMILAFGILVLVGAVAIGLVLLYPRLRGFAASDDTVDANATEPLYQEMQCIDRVVANRQQSPRDVQLQLNACRRGAGGNSAAPR